MLRTGLDAHEAGRARVVPCPVVEQLIQPFLREREPALRPGNFEAQLQLSADGQPVGLYRSAEASSEADDHWATSSTLTSFRSPESVAACLVFMSVFRSGLKA